MSMIGHNGGPSADGGRSWRTQCWRAAREQLLPVLPVEVVRLRVRRAAEFGLDYKTYAGVRAATGHDIVAFLFSTNALNLLRAADPVEPGRLRKLAAISGAGRMIAAQPPLDPGRVAAMLEADGVPVEAAGHAPTLIDSWSSTRATILALLAQGRRPADRVLLIGAAPLERDWVQAGRLAGWLPSERYFRA